jgi:hypothetical protein
MKSVIWAKTSFPACIRDHGTTGAGGKRPKKFKSLTPLDLIHSLENKGPNQHRSHRYPDSSDPGAIYHVMSRDDRREDIFPNGVDRQDFLKTLAEASKKNGHSHPIGIGKKAGTNCLALPHGRGEK